MSTVIELTKQLITLPSWVGAGCNEQKVAAFVYAWLKANTTLQVIKQPVKDGRFNVIATNSLRPRLLLVGHMDTVEPRAGWATDPWTPIVKNDRLYGLGATDMKGSLAAGLFALANVVSTQKVMFLAYCDEEYDFAGMRTFIQAYASKIKPQLIISLDGSAGQIGIGCRGLIEASFRLRGQTGHAGRPEAGINAITSGLNCINKLKRQLAAKHADSNLGVTTLNVAYCEGGLDNGQGGYGRQGNNIADLVEFVVDIRPATPVLNASVVNQLLLSYVKAAKLQLENWTVRHDLGSWLTPITQLSSLNLPGVFEPSLGYIDTQMLWSAFGRTPCATVGAGNLALAHKPNEYVEVENLLVTERLVERMISQ